MLWPELSANFYLLTTLPMMIQISDKCAHLVQTCCTAWKVSKYGVISGPYFRVFNLNTEKYGPEITPYLDTFHEVLLLSKNYLPISKVESFLKSNFWPKWNIQNSAYTKLLNLEL